MEAREIIWLDIFVEKLWRKHHVRTEEVEEVPPLDHVYGEWRVETSLARIYIQLWAEPHGGAI